MSAPPGFPDRFEAVNGPEDGHAFPVSRTPLDIGSDGSCGIFIAHDRDVKRFHARVTVVSDGYRIRRLPGGGGLWVDQRRAGYLRSRIVRHGGVVRAGNTELCLQTAPEGLASRSYGLPTENDLAWALRLAWRQARRMASRLLGALFRLPGVLRRHWILSLIAIGIAYYAAPQLFWRAWYTGLNALAWLRWYVQSAL